MLRQQQPFNLNKALNVAIDDIENILNKVVANYEPSA